MAEREVGTDWMQDDSTCDEQCHGIYIYGEVATYL
jgi:hypothetical protein